MDSAPVWFTSFGRLRFTRSGSSLRGEYDHKGGRVDGRCDGDRVSGEWSEPDHGKSGSFEWVFDAGGNTFRGQWRHDGESSWQGHWNGVVTDAPSPGDGRSFGSWNSRRDGPLLAGPMIGETSERSVRIWLQARAEGDAPRLSLVLEGPGGEEIRREIRPGRDDWYTASVLVEGLTPDTKYTYWIEGDGGDTTERSSVKTAPAESTRRAKIVFGSCYDDHEHPLPIFASMRGESPDLLLLIGDNCYYSEPDWQTEHTMMLAQLRNRNNPSFRAFGANVPVLGIWDDHDFGPNDSDARFEGKDMSLRVFKRVWAQRSYGLDGVPGIFSVVRWGPIEMFLLDGRYERLEKTQILGPAQMDWLLAALERSTAPIKLVVSGSQLLPLAAVEKEWECWRRDAPGELDRLLGFVAERDIQGVVYISGDVHLGYLLHEAGRSRADGRVGPVTWELTASPLSNSPWPEVILGPGQPHDPYIRNEFAEQNYGVVDVDLDRAGSEIRFVLKDPGGRVLVEQPIDLQTLKVADAGARPRQEEARRDPVVVAPSRDGGGAVSERDPNRIRAAILRGRFAHFIRGRDCLVYDLSTRTSGGSSNPWQPANDMYPRAALRDVDAAVAWPNGKAYFFQRQKYYRFDLANGAVDEGFPLDIGSHWPGVFPSDLDAAIVWTDDRAFFFRGGEYVRFDIRADRTDPGYPKTISEGWPGLWADGVDAALGPVDGKAWFFRGDQCIRWDVDADRMDDGYPTSIASEFPGL